jgi:putative transposase
VREGLEEMFTVNRLNLPASLRRCLGTTNLIDSTDSGVRQRTRRVTNWQSGSMALRWAAAGFVETEKNYRRIMGYQQLWMLKVALEESFEEESFATERKCG